MIVTLLFALLLQSVWCSSIQSSIDGVLSYTPPSEPSEPQHLMNRGAVESMMAGMNFSTLAADIAQLVFEKEYGCPLETAEYHKSAVSGTAVVSLTFNQVFSVPPFVVSNVFKDSPALHVTPFEVTTTGCKLWIRYLASDFHRRYDSLTDTPNFPTSLHTMVHPKTSNGCPRYQTVDLVIPRDGSSSFAHTFPCRAVANLFFHSIIFPDKDTTVSKSPSMGVSPTCSSISLFDTNTSALKPTPLTALLLNTNHISSTAQFGILAPSTYYGTVTFKTAFSSPPVVIVSVTRASVGTYGCNISALSSTSFSFQCFHNSNWAAPQRLHWIASLES